MIWNHSLRIGCVAFLHRWTAWTHNERELLTELVKIYFSLSPNFWTDFWSPISGTEADSIWSLRLKSSPIKVPIFAGFQHPHADLFESTRVIQWIRMKQKHFLKLKFSCRPAEFAHRRNSRTRTLCFVWKTPTLARGDSSTELARTDCLCVLACNRSAVAARVCTSRTETRVQE